MNKLTTTPYYYKLNYRYWTSAKSIVGQVALGSPNIYTKPSISIKIYPGIRMCG